MTKKSDCVAVILGDNYLAGETVKAFVDRYHIEDFDTRSFRGDSFDPDLFLNDGETLPVFSEKRLIIVSGIESIKKPVWEKILPFLSNPHEHVCIVLYGQSAKNPLTGLVRARPKQDTPESILFARIYQIRRTDRRMLFNVLREFLAERPEGFSLVISAVQQHLRSQTIREGGNKTAQARKFALLHELDFALKTGKIKPDAGIELFIDYALA